MRVELVAVGTELLLGDIVNGNAAWLGQRLAEAGVDVAHSTVVGDNIERIADVLRLGLSRADAVVVTGGIGPTQDDLTREALAAVAGVPLVRDAGLESALRDRFTALRRDVPEMNYRQADVPEGGTPLPNSKGTAPGMRLVVGAGVVYLMPGVPHEMEAMFAESVLPDLLTRAGEPAVIVNRVLRTAGMWESAVAAALGPLVERLAEQGNPTIAFLASAGQTRVRITAKAATYDDALAMVAPVEQEARAALGSGVYGTDDDTLDAVVIGLLRSRGETVAVAESLTGGLLGGLLTAGRGASDGFAGGVIAYSNDAKAALLGVGDDLLAAEGAVSAAVAAAMAAGVRARLRTTYGVALTGVAGPDGQDGQPVGTVFAGLATPDGVDTTQLRLPGDRARIRQYAAVAAVNLLRLHLVGAPAR
ncbi:MAG TPA: competence/damage-inducible protein A [Mycobacteriales bacterium]|nr:competence/damage-inducible protein A [Mycobacteriales bacterium]